MWKMMMAVLAGALLLLTGCKPATGGGPAVSLGPPALVTTDGGYWVHTGSSVVGGVRKATWTWAEITGGAALGAAAGAAAARLSAVVGNPCPPDKPGSHIVAQWIQQMKGSISQKHKRRFYLDCNALRNHMQQVNSATPKQILDCIAAIMTKGIYSLHDGEYLYNYRNAWVIINQRAGQVTTATAGRHGWQKCAEWK